MHKKQLNKKVIETVSHPLHFQAIATKRKTKNREDLGVRLYGMQQGLAKQQSSLESLHEIRNKAEEKRQHKEVELANSREDYKENKQLYNNDVKTSA